MLVKSTVPLLVALLLAALSHVATAAPVDAGEHAVVESSRHGDVVEIRAVADLAADRDTAWRVLTDYGRYTAFIPGLNESRVLARNGTTVTVEQAGSAAFGPLRIPVEVTYQIEESPIDRLESRAIAGSLRSLESRYTLTPSATGSRLVYSGRVRLAVPLFGGFGQSAVESNIARQFRALVGEIERQHGGEPATSDTVRR